MAPWQRLVRPSQLTWSHVGATLMLSRLLRALCFLMFAEHASRYPNYIHVLKVNPKSASATIENSAIWALTEAKDDGGDGGDPNEVPCTRATLE